MGGLTVGLLMAILVACATAQSDTIVRKPPKISKPSYAYSQFFRGGKTVTLECQASGTPDPLFSWYWNNVLITESTNKDMSSDAATGTLVITDLDKNKEGFFNCRAENTYGGISAVSVSPKVEVRVARVGAWNVNPNPALPLRATAGNYLALPCDDNLPESYGTTDFKWFKVVNSSQNEFTPDPRRFIDKFGTLHFTYLKEGDQTSIGTLYACALSNAESGIIMTGRKKRLIVNSNPSIPEVSPVLRYSSEVVTAKIGGEAQLECFFSGYSLENNKPVPFPQTYWTDGAKTIDTYDRFTVENDGRVLKIKTVRETDEGNYYCYGTNTQGTASGTVYLNVTSAPIWLVDGQVQSLTAVQGHDVQFNCKTRSATGENPPSPPRWYHNAVKRLDQVYDPNKYGFSEDKQTMTLKTVLKDKDIGCFQCYVLNSEGEVFSDGCLNVILPIEIITKPPPSQQVAEGELVNLTVVATSDPLMTLAYSWIFNNITYKDPDAPPHVTYDAVTRLAYINTSGFSDDEMDAISGVYTRKVYHIHQTKIVNVDVTLTAPTTPPPVAEAGFDYWIIGLIIGILLIIIVIIIICCVICRRKMLEGEYPVDRKETAAGMDPEKEAADSGFHDLSRADYDYMPGKKSPNNMDFEDQIPLGDDESFGSAEYGEEATAFNEDGSFLGQYSKRPGGPPGYNSESNV